MNTRTNKEPALQKAMATELGLKAISATPERNLKDRLANGNTPIGLCDERGSTTRWMGWKVTISLKK